MRILSLGISFLILILVMAGMKQDSPHGGDFKISCIVCHSPKGWELDREIYSFDHNTTQLPLEGQHNAIHCKACHPTLVFSEAETECFSCHTDMHNQTLGMDCGRCHTPKSWIVENITDVHRQSRFPLQGPHYAAQCLDCHPSASLLRFEPVGVECVDCHMQDYQSASEPNHVLGNLSTECLECHSMTSFTWGGSGFNHSFFPLTLGHAIFDCNQCHTGTDYSSTSAECFSCHQEDFNAATNPNHLTSDLSTDCMECHTTAPDWKPAQFDHSFFSLTFGHAITDCNQCHDPSNYSSVSAECFSCHETDYNSTTNPNHITAGIDNVCMECHTTMPGWKPANFDHASFPLTQGHTITDCNQCHDPSNYSSVSAECFSCHETDYNSTTNPNHITAGIDNVCMECHTTMPGWKPAIFDHTSFPLTQGHAITDCNQCHVPGNYSNVSAECFSCHETDYNSTTNPNHITAGIGNVCMECHTTMPGWKPAIFDHTSFPLTQGHAVNDCNQCHVPGNYSNVSAECFSCHETDYNATTNPNHITAGIDNVCMECHTTMPGWKPAKFTEHDGLFFPIYSGKHSGEWNSCTECHSNPANYSVFSCLDCHEHNKTSMDDKHSGMSGYEYNSLACLDCHPTGSED